MSEPHIPFTAIEKEIVASLRFPENEVLNNPESIAQRARDIERGMLLGNNYKGKVKILFEDSQGRKQIETTIWGFTDKRVLLKRDLVIPIHRVHSLSF